jgi:hypothetical protein
MFVLAMKLGMLKQNNVRHFSLLLVAASFRDETTSPLISEVVLL